MATTIVDKNLQNYYNKSIEVDKDIQKTFAFSMGDLKFLTN